MNEREVLLEAVVRAPKDAGARRVYADWLIEQGDPRGMFIALQFELAGKLGPVQRRRVQAEADALFKTNHAEWSAPLSAIGARGTFRCGFIREVEVETERLVAAGTERLRAEPIESLRLSGMTPALAYAIAAIAPWPSMVRLVIRGELGGEGMQALARSSAFPALESLNVAGCGVNAAGIEALVRNSGFAQIKTLVVSSNPLEDLGMVAIAKSPNARALEELYAANVGLTNRGAKMIAASAHLGALRKLGLERNPIDEDGEEALRALAHLELLELTPL